MRLRKTNVGIFTKNLVSLVVIFLIPFTILGFTMYQNTVGIIKSQIENTSLNQLEQIRNLIDLRLKELDNIAIRISYDPLLTPFLIRNDGFSARTAVEELGKYKANSAIIESLFLYFRGDPLIYSHDGSQSLNVVAQNHHLTDAARYQLYEDLNHSLSPLFRPDWTKPENGDLFAYYYPIRQSEGSHYGTVMYTIKKSVLIQFIDNVLGEVDGTVLIVDRSRNILVRHGEDDGVSVSRTREFINEIMKLPVGSGIQDKTYHAERYSLMRVTSETSGLTFAAIVPTEQFFRKVTEMRLFVIILMTIIVFIGSGAAVLLASRNSRPVRELADYIKKKWGASQKERTNELLLIRDIFTEVYDNQKELTKKVDLQTPWAYERVLSRLLSGTYSDTDHALAALKSIGMTIDADHFFVIVTNKAEEKDIKLIYPMFQKRFSFVYALELLQEEFIAILIGYKINHEIHPNVQDQAAGILKTYLCNSEDRRSPIVGIGTVYSNLTDINRSFIEAMTAIEYKFSPSSEHIIFFKDIHGRDYQSLWLPVKERVRFIESLKRGDTQAAHESIQEIFRSIEQNQPSLQSLKLICNDIILQIHTVEKELNFVYTQDHVSALMACNTLMEFEDKLNLIASELCNHVLARKQTRQKKFGGDLTRYIDSHFHSFDISIEHMAEIFNLSVSHLSRVIKEETGFTFTEYITRLRFEKIKTELISTNKPIHTIIHDAGYLDASNFIRKFRNTIGMTPGQYRKSNAIARRQKVSREVDS